MTTTTQNTYTFNAASVYNVNASFTLQTPIAVNTAMTVYQQAYNYINSNYVVFINVGNMQNLFSNASYNDYLNSVNVNLTLNESAMISLLNSNATSVFYRGTNGANDSVCGFEKMVYDTTNGSVFTSTSRTLGYRILELAANGIFGNAKSRSAIKNDTDYIYGSVTDTVQSKPLYNSIANQLATSFNTDRFNIFNQYVNSSRYSGSVDSNQYQNFNFTAANIQVLLTTQINTVGTQNNYANSIGGFPTTVNKSILLMLTESYNFNNIASDLHAANGYLGSGAGDN